MEEKIKEIISVFTKIPVDQIGPATPIGRSAMQSSILLHRMYARLAEEGLAVDNYGNIKVFADLLAYGQADVAAGPLPDAVLSVPIERSPVPWVPETSVTSGIGIDIEEVAGLPLTNDFRKEAFYKMNFTAAEIAYCILQPDPYSSFTGLFAAKEAIIKADGRYRLKVFNSIEIGHSQEGKPLHPGFDLSISHAGKMAVAVAVPVTGDMARSITPGTPVWQAPVPAKRATGAFLLAGLALILSIIALIIVLTHRHE